MPDFTTDPEIAEWFEKLTDKQRRDVARIFQQAENQNRRVFRLQNLALKRGLDAKDSQQVWWAMTYFLSLIAGEVTQIAETMTDEIIAEEENLEYQQQIAETALHLADEDEDGPTH